jgi:inorganic pyrophosphatase
VSRNGTGRRALADPSRLAPGGNDGDDTIRVVIETPKGSRNKYAFNAEEKIFELKKVLPAGMDFPFDFGFVPSTKAQDGDPVDVLVLMDEPAFPGCVLKCRIIGVIEGVQAGKKGKERNDRIIAIAKQNHSWSDIRHVDDLGKQFREELEQFFTNYHGLSGEEYKVIAMKGPSAASKCIERAQKGVRRK